MGHIEYASPECLHLHDLVTYEMAGDELLRSALTALEANGGVSFIKNNVDHHTGATFNRHENYLMKREAQLGNSLENSGMASPRFASLTETSCTMSKVKIGPHSARSQNKTLAAVEAASVLGIF